jgi:hypothetical protein
VIFKQVMTSNSEHIEAMLLAYVEGELPQGQQAQLQQMLAGHPEYRQLLTDLVKARQWTRGLPRARAPMDLAETLSGQLERSVLLDEPASRGDALVMRPNRLPQLMAVAAIVLLALGLGLVIYKVLPGDRDRAAEKLAIGPDRGTALKHIRPVDEAPDGASAVDAHGAASGASTQPAPFDAAGEPRSLPRSARPGALAAPDARAPDARAPDARADVRMSKDEAGRGANKNDASGEPATTPRTFAAQRRTDQDLGIAAAVPVTPRQVEDALMQLDRPEAASADARSRADAIGGPRRTRGRWREWRRKR